MSASPQSSAVGTAVSNVTSGPSANFGRTAVAILATMVILIVALTGILVQTTWHHTASDVEAGPPDPGSVARR